MGCNSWWKSFRCHLTSHAGMNNCIHLNLLSAEAMVPSLEAVIRVREMVCIPVLAWCQAPYTTVSRGVCIWTAPAEPVEGMAHLPLASCMSQAFIQPHALNPIITTAGQLGPQSGSTDRKISDTWHCFLSPFSLYHTTQGQTAYFPPPLEFQDKIHAHIFHCW